MWSDGAKRSYIKPSPKGVFNMPYTPSPTRGGKRPGSGRKPRADTDHPARTETVSVKVEPDLKRFIIEQGGSAYLYKLIQRDHIQSLII